MTSFTQTALILLSFLALGIAGCAALTGDNADRGRLAVQYATMKVIDNQSSRAERVQAFVADARTYIEEGHDVIIDDLADELRSRIKWQNLDAADQILIDQIITRAQERLEENLSGGLLSEPERQDLLTILEWIDDAASKYTRE